MNSINIQKIIKLYLPSEIRRFKIKDNSYTEFLKIIQNETKTPYAELQYMDDDQKWIAFSSEKEWDDALKQTNSNTTLRIRVINQKLKFYETERYQASEIRSLPSDFFLLKV